MADEDLGETESEIGVSQWPDDTVIPNMTGTSQPALTASGDALYLAYAQAMPDATMLIRTAKWQGGPWYGPVQTTRATTTSPALTTFNGRLHLFYRPPGQNTLTMVTADPADASSYWESPRTAGRPLTIGNYAASAPQATVIGGNLYLTYCSNNGELRQRR